MRYWNQKNRWTAYSCLSNGMPARRNLSLNLASEPLVEVGVNKSGEADSLDDVEYLLI